MKETNLRGPTVTVNIQSVSHSTFLRGDTVGGVNLTTNRYAWENWNLQFIDTFNYYITLKSDSHGTWLSATSTTTVALITASTPTDYEKWHLEVLSGPDQGYFAFRNLGNNQYLRGDSNTDVNLTSIRSSWERWFIEDAPDSLTFSKVLDNLKKKSSL
eukprot:TRINITY_DN14319_c0_g1_i1.p1 TRINITY_DN14319_c0_g1~~TRINITY_DN14319_c0_g1_i1.p1  ORF type:complete len:158 (+),score=37.30 TRINITY_DN14319_c0_g1_i1:24-497(+)